MTRQIGIIVLALALIALLAAIIFPVFAQAKNAAAKSSSHSRWLNADDSMMQAGEALMHYAARLPGAERSVLRDATLSVGVENLEKAETKVQESIAAHGGYIDHEEGDDLAGGEPVMRLTIRVPEKSFDQEMSEFEALGHRTEKSISSTDLTEQILDAEAQVKQAEQDDKEFTAEQLAQFRADRDQIAAKVTMSSIDLTIQQRPSTATAAAASAGWGSDVWNSAVTSAMGSFRLVGSIVIWLFVYSPLWAVPCLIALYVRKHWKRSQGLAA